MKNEHEIKTIFTEAAQRETPDCWSSIETAVEERSNRKQKSSFTPVYRYAAGFVAVFLLALTVICVVPSQQQNGKRDLALTAYAAEGEQTEVKFGTDGLLKLQNMRASFSAGSEDAKTFQYFFLEATNDVETLKLLSSENANVFDADTTTNGDVELTLHLTSGNPVMMLRIEGEELPAEIKLEVEVTFTDGTVETYSITLERTDDPVFQEDPTIYGEGKIIEEYPEMGDDGITVEGDTVFQKDPTIYDDGDITVEGSTDYDEEDVIEWTYEVPEDATGDSYAATFQTTNFDTAAYIIHIA